MYSRVHVRARRGTRVFPRARARARVCARVYVCVRATEPQYNGRPRTGVELEERTEREALFAYGTTLYNVERLFRYLQGVCIKNIPGAPIFAR